ncbi:hypothetical protein OG923_34405 (plasmid) [Streptomyces halstedii]|uniref:hypothetical protein n=1 Tax=Streptomyces halstedii TaxID=1944 RepID=UPI002F914BCE
MSAATSAVRCDGDGYEAKAMRSLQEQQPVPAEACATRARLRVVAARKDGQERTRGALDEAHR